MSSMCTVVRFRPVSKVRKSNPEVGEAIIRKARAMILQARQSNLEAWGNTACFIPATIDDHPDPEDLDRARDWMFIPDWAKKAAYEEIQKMDLREESIRKARSMILKWKNMESQERPLEYIPFDVNNVYVTPATVVEAARQVEEIDNLMERNRRNRIKTKPSKKFFN